MSGEVQDPASRRAIRLEEGAVKVYVGGFDALVRRGLVDILGDDQSLDVLGADVDALAVGEPQVAIVDGVAEGSVAAGMSSVRPEVGLVVLAYKPAAPYGMMLLAAGVTCLPWSASEADVLHAVHLTAQGGCIFVGSDGSTAERRDRRKERVLSRREIQMLERVSEGRSPGEIALELKISVETVRKHTASLRRKLKVASKRDLVGIEIPPALRSAR